MRRTVTSQLPALLLTIAAVGFLAGPELAFGDNRTVFGELWSQDN